MSLPSMVLATVGSAPDGTVIHTQYINFVAQTRRHSRRSLRVAYVTKRLIEHR